MTAWEAELHAAPADEEPDADQLHASNIIRGWVHLLRGEPDGAVDCLRAAGRVGGSAVLCSF